VLYGGQSGVLSLLVDLYIIVIFVYVLATWIPEWRYQSWHRTLGSICEPYLGIFRRIVPPVGMADLSPMVAILVLAALAQLLRLAGL